MSISRDFTDIIIS